MADEKYYAAEDFDYKNNYVARQFIDESLPADHLFHYKKGDLLPKEVGERRIWGNPFSVTRGKQKESEPEKPKDEETPIPSEEPKKKLSRKELIELNQAEQIELLVSYGLTKKEAKALKSEGERVDKILELQGGD